MKIVRTTAVLLAFAPLIAVGARSAAGETARPWCVVYSGRDGAYTCIFSSFDQCMMTATPGTGGSCVQNPWYAQSRPSSTGQATRSRR
jgi:uncharacterized protein DUF3551